MSDDIKRFTRSLGKNLKASNHSVPHAALLNAVAAANGDGNWRALRARASKSDKATVAASVWVALYDNQYGVTTRVFANKELGLEWKNEIARDSWDEKFPDEERPEDESLLGEEYFSMMQDEGDDPESFVLQEHQVEGLTPSNAVEPMLSRPVKVYLGVQAIAEWGESPDYACIEVTDSWLTRLLDLQDLAKTKKLSGVTVYDSPEWSEDTYHLALEELVVSTDSFYFTAYPKHADYQVQTNIVSIKGLLEAVLEGRGNDELSREGQVVFHPNIRDDLVNAEILSD